MVLLPLFVALQYCCSTLTAAVLSRSTRSSTYLDVGLLRVDQFLDDFTQTLTHAQVGGAWRLQDGVSAVRVPGKVGLRRSTFWGSLVEVVIPLYALRTKRNHGPWRFSSTPLHAQTVWIMKYIRRNNSTPTCTTCGGVSECTTKQ